MARDVEATSCLLKDPTLKQNWLHDEEDEEEEEDNEEVKYGEETFEKDKKWTVVVSGFVVYFLSSLVTSNYGILFSSRLLELGASSGFVSCVANISIATSCLVCLPVASILHRWGCRRTLLPIAFLYCGSFILAALTYWTPVPYAVASIIAVSCRQAFFMLMQVAVCSSFDRWRPLALGVSVAGAPLSQIIHPPIYALLQRYYDLRTIIMMTSVFMVQICFAAIPLPLNSECNKPTRKDSYLSMLKRRKVVLLCLLIAINGSTVGIFWNTIPLILFDAGLTSQDLVLYLSIPGVANLAFRLFTGILLCHFNQMRTACRLVSAIFTATIPVWYCCESLFWRLAWLSLCWGSTGAMMSLTSLVILEVVGAEIQAEILGLANVFAAVITLLIGQIIDLVRLVTADEGSKLYSLSLIVMLSQLLWESLESHVRRNSSGSSPSRDVQKKDTDKYMSH